MPRKTEDPEGGNKKAKNAKIQVKSTPNRVSTRNRSRTMEDVGKDAVVLDNNKQIKRKSEPTDNKASKKVARRIEFDEKVQANEVNQTGQSNMVGQCMGVNNNATITHQGKKKGAKDMAQSNPNVFDRNHEFSDGVDVNVDSAEEDALAGGSEYESDEEQELQSTKQCDNNRNDTIVEGQGTDGTQFNAAEYQAILKDKTLMRVFDHLLKEKVEIAKKEIMETANSVISSGISHVRKGFEAKIIKEKPTYPIGGINLKSPSDTTLYAPAVKRKSLENDRSPNKQTHINNNVIHDIAAFVESIRVSERDRAEAGGSGQNSQQQLVTEQSEQHDRDVAAYAAAKEKAENAVLEAEKFKAVLADPPGEFQVVETPVSQINQPSKCLEIETIRDIGSGISDDDFFHLTCHVDSALISKIEKGEFVDLDKLLPKDKRKKFIDDNRMEWVHSDGGTFLAPVSDRTSKITNFRRWEQAFRVYATIYCGANPRRSKEIWQYITVISTAASSYMWDNVSEYDVTFRHLMAFNPNRSWAVTYNQCWNLCMREPMTPRFNTFQKPANNFAGGNSGGKFNTGHKKRGKPDYCWNFNRGIPCKYGKKCRFIERCSYCDNGSHGINQCPKLTKAEKEAALAAIIPAVPANSASAAAQPQ